MRRDNAPVQEHNSSRRVCSCGPSAIEDDRVFRSASKARAKLYHVPGLDKIVFSLALGLRVQPDKK